MTQAVSSALVAPSLVSVQGTSAQNDGQAVLIQKMMEQMQRMEAEEAHFRQQAAIGETLNMTSNYMMDLVNASKRVREEKKELPEEPVLVTWSSRGEKAVDDNHTEFAWEVRRMVKQPNAHPKEYWSQAKYKMKVEPNLRESLFLQHLMPLGN
jgi:hypothetical protein